jgi:hypothetical protein
MRKKYLPSSVVLYRGMEEGGREGGRERCTDFKES